MRAFTSIAFLGLALSVSGCNLIMDLGRFSEPISTDAGAGDGGGAPGPFDCLNLPSETLDPGPVTVHLLVTNATSASESAAAIDGGSDLDEVVYTAVPGVTIVSCLPLDPGCANPVTTAGTTGADGRVDLALTGNFVGFFRGTASGRVPFSLFPGRWLTGLKEANYFTSSLTVSDEQLLNLSLGNAVNLDAGAGLGEVFIIVYDCNDRLVSGATISMSRAGSDTLPFYIIAGVPNTTVQVTDSTGVGGAVNVPAGTLRATATFLATSTTLGSIDVYVRPAELTYARIRMRVH